MLSDADATSLQRQQRSRAFAVVWKVALSRLQALADEGADSEIKFLYELSPSPCNGPEDFVLLDWSMQHSKPIGRVFWERAGKRTPLGDAPLDVRARVVNAVDQIVQEHQRYVQWLSAEIDRALRSKTR